MTRRTAFARFAVARVVRGVVEFHIETLVKIHGKIFHRRGRGLHI